MDLNTIGLSLIGAVISYLAYVSWSIPPEVSRTMPGFLVAQDTGKTHYRQTKTGDVSMTTELRRRQAIQYAGRFNPKFKPSLGTLSGAIETYMLTAICVCTTCIATKVLYDGGNAVSEFCPIHDGATYDGGTSTTNACASCVQTDTVYTGGGATAEFCPIHDGATYDAGKSNTRVCGI